MFHDKKAEAIWKDGKVELLAQLRDAVLGASLLGFVIIPFAALRALGFIGVDTEMVSFLSFIDKWGTIAVFAIFWWGLIVRAIAGVKRRRS